MTLYLGTGMATRAALALDNLGIFVRQAWEVIEPGTPYVSGDHVDLMCRALEELDRGEIKRLLINVPPRHMKSRLVSVFYPAWALARDPTRRLMFASYASDLSRRDSIDTRTIIESSWYQERWGAKVKLTHDQNTTTRFATTERGYRIATSVGGSVTGLGGDVLVIDDPHKADEAASQANREAVMRWFDQAWSTRLNDPKTSRMVIIMQRLHEEDLAGHVLQKGGWEHLCLPAEWDAKHPYRSVRDWRTTDGELLWPARVGPAEIEQQKLDLGSYGAAGQLQQLPAPGEGGEVKREWWRYYKELPAECDRIICSWDTSFTDAKTSDYAVGQVWARVGARYYLLAQIRERMTFTEARDATIQQYASVVDEAGSCDLVLVEKAANGPALIDVLHSVIPCVLPVKPRDSKVARARAVAPTIEAGNVYLPDPSIAPWIGDYVNEWSVFPLGAHDDQVDATSQALQWLKLDTPAGTTTLRRAEIIDGDADPRIS